ncbi:MAG: hypothetical protein FAF03_07045 [Epsilonproteobacteria bacterium]|nr:hypothetical protein [Campylobacterota bacterium]
MSNKLTVQNRDDIPKIIEAMTEIHGNDVIGDIVDGLLNSYSSDLLMDIVKNRISTKQQNKSRNDYFLVGLNVYRYVYDHECDMGVAIKYISEQSYYDGNTKSMTENTIKTHLDNFKKQIRSDMKGLTNSPYFDIKKDSDKRNTGVFI